MAFIEVIGPEEASGSLKEIYRELEKQRGKLARIHTIQSLHPESITAHMDLYMQIMFGKSPLSRARREMMAVVVSATNGCEYCRLHHGEALNHYWKDQDRVAQLAENYRELELDKDDLLLCRLAEKLTASPGKISEEQDIESLKEAGLTDRGILDGVLVVSYFNFVNRIVLGLGVETDEEEMSGYTY
ncbi:MAG: peroxidase-related enzyme [Balneolaceae bacterium]|nr:peroxidase-related enzyme [Balneolaceae bacterium]